jgi:formylglycine-generating enzyme required for sulfatase activity
LLRGGNWLDDSGLCRASQRSYLTPGLINVFIGFRVVRTP